MQKNYGLAIKKNKKDKKYTLYKYNVPVITGMNKSFANRVLKSQTKWEKDIRN